MADEASRPRYLEQLERSLRVRDVPPERTQEVLAEIGDHLASTGESPEETFGPPWELADALVEARPAPPVPRQPARLAVLAAAAFAAPWLLFDGGRAVLSDTTTTVTLGDVLGVAVFLLAAPVIIVLTFACVDGRRRMWQPFVACTAMLGAVMLVRALIDAPVIHDGSGWLLVGVGLACVGVVVAIVRGGLAGRGTSPEQTLTTDR